MCSILKKLKKKLSHHFVPNFSWIGHLETYANRLKQFGKVVLYKHLSYVHVTMNLNPWSPIKRHVETCQPMTQKSVCYPRLAPWVGYIYAAGSGIKSQLSSDILTTVVSYIIEMIKLFIRVSSFYMWCSRSTMKIKIWLLLSTSDVAKIHVYNGPHISLDTSTWNKRSIVLMSARIHTEWCGRIHNSQDTYMYTFYLYKIRS